MKDLKQHLQNGLDNHVNDLILFGSQSTGKNNADSDYDVLIVLEKEYNYQEKNKIYNLCYDMDLKYDILIDAHMISESEINSKRGWQPIFINAIKNGIHI